MGSPIPQEEEIRAIGKTVRRLRKERKLSMQKLAHLADMELMQIHRLELGQVNSRLATVISIARALGVSPRELFPE